MKQSLRSQHNRKTESGKPVLLEPESVEPTQLKVEPEESTNLEADSEKPTQLKSTDPETEPEEATQPEAESGKPVLLEPESVEPTQLKVEPEESTNLEADSEKPTQLKSTDPETEPEEGASKGMYKIGFDHTHVLHMINSIGFFNTVIIFLAESTSGSEEFESCDDNNSEEEIRSLPSGRNSSTPEVHSQFIPFFHATNQFYCAQMIQMYRNKTELGGKQESIPVGYILPAC